MASTFASHAFAPGKVAIIAHQSSSAETHSQSNSNLSRGARSKTYRAISFYMVPFLVAPSSFHPVSPRAPQFHPLPSPHLVLYPLTNLVIHFASHEEIKKYTLSDSRTIDQHDLATIQMAPVVALDWAESACQARQVAIHSTSPRELPAHPRQRALAR